MSGEAPSFVPESEQFRTGTLERNKPNRLVYASEVMANSLFRVSLHGEERLKEVSPDKKIIVAFTHLSDLDGPLAMAAMAQYDERFNDAVVADSSSHYEFAQNPPAFLARKLLNEKNFARIEHTRGGAESRGILDPSNFEALKVTLDQGRAVFIASYYDPKYAGFLYKLPEKIGKGAALLSQITENASVVPVSVDIGTKRPIGLGPRPNYQQLLKEGRPPVSITIGKPLEFKRIPEIEKLKELLRQPQLRAQLTEEESAGDADKRKGILFALKYLLTENQKEIVREQAKGLPTEKRGPW
jgi:hypothetical protein